MDKSWEMAFHLLPVNLQHRQEALKESYILASESPMHKKGKIIWVLVYQLNAGEKRSKAVVLEDIPAWLCTTRRHRDEENCETVY